MTLDGKVTSAHPQVMEVRGGGARSEDGYFLSFGDLLGMRLWVLLQRLRTV